MIAVELVFNCEHCGDPLGQTAGNSKNVVLHDEVHGCFGEVVGFVAEVTDKDVVLAEGVELEVKKLKER